MQAAVASAIALSVLTLSISCQLTRDYSEVLLEEQPDTGDTDLEVADATTDADSGRDVADVVEDADPRDAPSTDAGDILDGSDDVADAPNDGSDASGPSCPTTRPSYVVEKSAQTPVIDGDCSEFSGMTKLPIPPPGTTGDGPANSSDNTVNCRLAWLEGSPGKIHGCCDVSDDDLVATAQPDDPPEEIHAGADGGDDRLEAFFSCLLTEEKTSCTTKILINNLAPPTHFDLNFPDGTYNYGHSSNVRAAVSVQGTHNDGPGDTGYAIEWLQDLAFDLDGGEAGLCNFMMLDEDEGEPKSAAQPFGPAGTVNYPSEWGCCKFQ